MVENQIREKYGEAELKNYDPFHNARTFQTPKATCDVAYGCSREPNFWLHTNWLDVVREVITFWKTNKEHIYIPNYRDGLFKITQSSEAEMAEFAR